MSIKVVLVGDTQVGKTCIISRLVNDVFKGNNPATIGAAFQTFSLTTDSGTVTLQIWDTAGQEKYRSLTPMYYRSAEIAILCYDVTNARSFESMEQWTNELVEKAPPNMQLIIAGNKIDLAEERVISEASARAFADKNGAAYYAEVSAKAGEGVKELFIKAAECAEARHAANATSRPSADLARPAEPGKRCC